MMCTCGHALSQHPDRGKCDYSGHTCECEKFTAVNKSRKPELTPNEACVLKWILSEEGDIVQDYAEDMDVDFDALFEKIEKLSEGATNG